jgi:hypothetical protein
MHELVGDLSSVGDVHDILLLELGGATPLPHRCIEGSEVSDLLWDIRNSGASSSSPKSSSKSIWSSYVGGISSCVAGDFLPSDDEATKHRGGGYGWGEQLLTWSMAEERCELI